MLRWVLNSIFILSTVYACTDRNTNCPSWKFLCKNNKEVRDICKKTCGECSSAGSGGSGSSEKCGISKIANAGADADTQPGAWPWIVSLQTKWGYHFCGGSILSSTWIMTTGDCILTRKDKPSGVMVVAGAHDIKAKEESQQKIIAKRIIRHPGYDFDKHGSNNIALIELSTPLKMNDRVMRACLPKQYVKPKAREDCIFAGWGKGSTKVQQAKFSILPRKLNWEHIFARFKQQKNKQPSISYGNPLMCQRSDKTWQIDGAASFRNSYSHFTAFSPINTVLRWLIKNISDL